MSTVILFVISASAPTCKLKESVFATVAYPLLILKDVFPVAASSLPASTVAFRSVVPILFAANNSA